MSVSERIKALRMSLGLTQSKFAERVSISASYLGEIEAGAKIANERVLRLISIEFNVNEDWLRSGDGEMLNQEVDVHLANAISLFKSLNPPFKVCALSLLNALADLHSTPK